MLNLFVRLVLSMAVVMAVMWLAARFVRHRQGSVGPLAYQASRSPRGRGRQGAAPGGLLGPLGTGKARRSRPVPPVGIVYRRQLAKGAWLAVVESATGRYLLGVTEHSVNLLTELPAEGPVADLAGLGPAAVDLAADGPRLAVAGHGTSGTADLARFEGLALGDLSLVGAGEQDLAGRTPASAGRPPIVGEHPDNAWKLVLDSLRERTVRR
jgi:hypothetical protein